MELHEIEKIIRISFILGFFVVLTIINIQLIIQWFCCRYRRTQFGTHRTHFGSRWTHFNFSGDNNPSTTPSPNSLYVSSSRGLQDSVIRSLPIFIYSSNDNQDEERECAVCLSKFEENEKGRLLPHCNHIFHIECIDMWFHSHITCPLCRSVVNRYNPPPTIETTPVENMISYSSLMDTKMPPMECRRTPLDLVGISIEVPSRDRYRAIALSCSTSTEMDIEQGEEKVEDHHYIRQEQRESD